MSCLRSALRARSLHQGTDHTPCLNFVSFLFLGGRIGGEHRRWKYGKGVEGSYGGADEEGRGPAAGTSIRICPSKTPPPPHR